MFYIDLEIYLSRDFLGDDCYFKQIISAVAKESPISYSLTQRVPETQNLYYYNTKSHPKPNQTKINYSSVFLKGSFCFAQK